MSLKNYTTKAKVQTFLDETISDTLEDIMLAVEDYIDGYTGRNFKADESATARKYSGNGMQELNIDECIEITKVERGNNEYGDTKEEISAGGMNGYYLWPENYSEEGVPIRKVHIRGRYWIAGWQNHQITAKWGYSETPPSAVSQAATILSACIYKHGESGGVGGVQGEKIGDYSVNFKSNEESSLESEFKRAKALLDKYKKLEI